MEPSVILNNFIKKTITYTILGLFSCSLYAQRVPENGHYTYQNSLPKGVDLDLTTSEIYNKYPWSLMYYYAKTVNGALVGTVVGNYKRWPEHIQSIELAHTLSPDNAFRNFFKPIVGVVQLAVNGTVRHGADQNTIYEFNPYIIWRWANFPWNRYIPTSLALAEGISYVTSVPSIEKRDNSNTKRILNYLMFEATFALPDHPRWQFLVRIHHRSGAYGLYGAGNTGSNDIGAGLRYLF